MKNSPIIVKIMVVVLLPLLFVLYYSTRQVISAREASKSILLYQELSDLSILISNYVHECQKERGATAVLYSGDGTYFRKEVNTQRLLTDTAQVHLMAGVAKIERENTPLEVYENLQSAVAMAKELQHMRKKMDERTIPANTAIGYYTKMNAEGIKTIYAISTATTDRDLSSMLSSYVFLQQGKERAGIERAIASRSFNLDYFSPQDATLFTKLIHEQKQFSTLFINSAPQRYDSVYQSAMNDGIIRSIDSIEKVVMQSFHEKADITNLALSVGYGGFIHSFKNYLLRGDQEYYTRGREQLERAFENLDKLTKSPTVTTTRKQLYGEIGTTLREYEDAHERVRLLHSEGSSAIALDKAVKINDTKAVAALQQLTNKGNYDMDSKLWFGKMTHKINKMKSVVDWISKDIEAYLTTSVAKSNRLFLMSLSISIGSLLVTILLSWYISRLLTKPIYSVVSVLDGVAKGDLSKTIAYRSNDEIGRIALSLNSAIQSMKESREEIEKNSALIEQTLADVERVKEHSQGILANIGAPMLVVDRMGLVESINEPALALLQRQEREVVGTMHAKELLQSSDANITIETAMAEGCVVTGELLIQTSGKSSVEISTICNCLKDSDGTVTGGVQVFFDMTEQKETLRIIAHLIDAANEGNLEERAPLGDSKGDYRHLREGINEMLDSIITPIKEASDVLTATAQRDLSQRINGEYLGSFDLLKRNVNLALVNIDEAMSQVSVAAGQVSAASTQISEGAQSLSQGTSEQASSLEEISASMEEMLSQTKHNASNANEAQNIANEAQAFAGRGTDAMYTMSEAMSKIKNSSNETARIIKTIDEIATQTNLLALNAAVEAARAGEAGLGFAVVADEVRNLAQRSAEAAKDTANMIEESMENAQNGVAIANDVASILDGIQNSSQKVSSIIMEISQASKEQATGIQQINEAVTELNNVTQMSAANSEESASASEELSAQAEELRALTSMFTLSEGDGGPVMGRHSSQYQYAGSSEASQLGYSEY